MLSLDFFVDQTHSSENTMILPFGEWMSCHLINMLELCRKYTDLLTTLGDLDGTASESYKVCDKNSLDKILFDPKFSKANKIQLVEVVMGKYDTPRALKMASGLYEQRAAKQPREG